MKLTKEEKNLILDILDDYGYQHDLWDLPQDSDGKYYPNHPDAPNDQIPYDEPFMAHEANLISSLIERIYQE